MTEIETPSTATPEVADRWVEALQILAGDSDNPTASDRAQLTATRLKMFAAIESDALRRAIEAARGEYLEDATGTPEDEAYNQAVSDVVAAIGALLEEGK